MSELRVNENPLTKLSPVMNHDMKQYLPNGKFLYFYLLDFTGLSKPSFSPNGIYWIMGTENQINVQSNKILVGSLEYKENIPSINSRLTTFSIKDVTFLMN